MALVDSAVAEDGRQVMPEASYGLHVGVLRRGQQEDRRVEGARRQTLVVDDGRPGHGLADVHGHIVRPLNHGWYYRQSPHHSYFVPQPWT
jgi:hypothetical protein